MARSTRGDRVTSDPQDLVSVPEVIGGREETSSYRGVRLRLTAADREKASII